MRPVVLLLLWAGVTLSAPGHTWNDTEILMRPAPSPDSAHGPPPLGGGCRFFVVSLQQFIENTALAEFLDFEKEFAPICDKNGNFEPRQCYEVAPGEKWCLCVDVISGRGRPNTMSRGEGLVCDENGKVTKPCCPNNWSLHTERGLDTCYAFYGAEKSWAEAESFCLFEGGHLASIHSEETHHFLKVLTQRENLDFPMSWTGGTNAVEPCLWIWSDGQVFDFEDWFSEECKLRQDSCLHINYGCGANLYKWSSSSCNNTMPFICAKEPECH